MNTFKEARKLDKIVWRNTNIDVFVRVNAMANANGRKFILGSISGACRLVKSITVAIFALIGATFCFIGAIIPITRAQYLKGAKECGMTALENGKGCIRGLVEILPFTGYALAKYDIKNHKSNIPSVPNTGNAAGPVLFEITNESGYEIEETEISFTFQDDYADGSGRANGSGGSEIKKTVKNGETLSIRKVDLRLDYRPSAVVIGHLKDMIKFKMKDSNDVWFAKVWDNRMVIHGVEKYQDDNGRRINLLGTSPK